MVNEETPERYEDVERNSVYERSMEDVDEDRAILLLSSGVDSSALLVHALKESNELFPINFTYGQMAWDVELQNSENLVEWAQESDEFDCEVHDLLNIDLTGALDWVDTGLTMSEDNVEKAKEEDEKVLGFVPMRNALFLSNACSFAAQEGCGKIYWGLSKDDEDIDGWTDSNTIGDFVEMMEDALNWEVVKGEVEILTPLREMEIGRAGELELLDEHGAPLEYVHSCYEPTPCGDCLSCTIRDMAFRDADVEDPLDR